MTESVMNRFNLIREQWIPITGRGEASLQQIFEDEGLPGIGGNPIEKISLMKLAIAIAQAAYTPKDKADWQSIGVLGLMEICAQYLVAHENEFWLYGDQPFLQMPSIRKAEKVSYGAVMPMIATGNTTILLQSQLEGTTTDAEIAVLLVTLSSFALGGKKTDNSLVLTPGYMGKSNIKGKPATGKSGPSLGYLGYLHNLILGRTIQESIWLNLLTLEDLSGIGYFSQGLGQPVWERMPAGEDDTAAREARESYIGRLVPLSRFILLSGDGLHYSEGIAYPGHKDGAQDVSVAISSGMVKKALWANPDKRPWRQLLALLAFFDATSHDGYDCPLLRLAIPRALSVGKDFILWSGGLKVSSNAGEQYVSGRDDFVESEVALKASWLGEVWFRRLKLEMEALSNLGNAVFGAVISYFKKLKADGSGPAAKASEGFWADCESVFQGLVDACGSTDYTERAAIRVKIALFAETRYDQACPREGARQIDSWAEHRISTWRYLHTSEPEATDSPKVTTGKRKKV